MRTKPAESPHLAGELCLLGRLEARSGAAPLVCACYRESVNFRILSTSLAPDHLLSYLRNEPSSDALTPAALVDEPSELPVVTMEYSLGARLHPKVWADAIAYFGTRPESPSFDVGPAKLSKAAEAAPR